MEDLSKSVPSNLCVSEDKELDVWLTMLILRCLEEFYNEKKKSWSMLKTKGMKWLADQSVDQKLFEDKLSELIGIM